jgi:Ca2+-binding RTX toxin-like protein
VLLAGLVVGLLAVTPASASALCFGELPTITGTSDGETILGTGADDVIEAGDGDDIVDGAGGLDRICGEGGDDTINGQTGADQLDGGTNTSVGDTVTFAGLSSVNANLSAGTADHNGPTPDTLERFENLTGTNSGDVLEGDDGPNVITGGGGPDGFTPRLGNDTLDDDTDSATFLDEARYQGTPAAISANLTTGVVTGGSDIDVLIGVPAVQGTSFPDQLVGNAGVNYFYGASGNDTIEPRAGDDYVDGEGDVDTVTYAAEAGPGGVTANLSSNTPPNVTTSTGTNESAFNVENVIGTEFNDTITGTTGANVIDGRGLDDILNGFGGNDTASFAGLAETVNASLLAGGATGQGTDTLTDFDNLTGSSQGDVLIGDANANALLGGSGADQITGGGSADSLALGPGSDIVTATDGLTDAIDCTGGGPDSGSVDTSPAETYTACDSDSDALVDFLDACPIQFAGTADGCPPAAAPIGPTGQRAAALKQCKKKKTKQKRKKCKKKANRLPV